MKRLLTAAVIATAAALPIVAHATPVTVTVQGYYTIATSGLTGHAPGIVTLGAGSVCNHGCERPGNEHLSRLEDQFLGRRAHRRLDDEGFPRVRSSEYLGHKLQPLQQPQ
jgi:hypothetical protein